MRRNCIKNSVASWVRGFAALCAALAAAAGSSLAAPTETVLHSFTGSDGDSPDGGLIADGTGNLYGTTKNGGAAGKGVVFKLSPSGTYTVLHFFTGSDGAYPRGGVIADSNGNLYGTTFESDVAKSGCADGGCGVVFKLLPSGTETVLYSFCSLPLCSDGANPAAGLIADGNGNLYGITEYGGSGGDGVVFKLSPSGTETVLHSFTGSDGAFPQSSRLIADSNGNLYGTTNRGGSRADEGVVFKLSSSGTETVLYTFCSLPLCSDGAGPTTASLLADANGNLYGIAGSGGASNNGVVFKLTPSGTYTVLHSFTGTDGATAFSAGLIADSSGDLYGTTTFGGASNNGVVFKLSSSGTETVLYTFCSLPGCSDGAGPTAGLLADSKGNLYGTAGAGEGHGVVFELTGTGFASSPHAPLPHDPCAGLCTGHPPMTEDCCTCKDGTWTCKPPPE